MLPTRKGNALSEESNRYQKKIGQLCEDDFGEHFFDAATPTDNGAVERLNQTLQEEFYKVAFRKKLSRSLEEIQIDLDEFMNWYKTERTNQGHYCQGRTERAQAIHQKHDQISKNKFISAKYLSS